ncbi:M20 metallopeptidase family protein [Celerinatantimonas diazotrophica]|uniref:Amidohydrolase n=1 Tax=Celerinatantimonas diazotrophica TaxID=412034 RepID=A0A4R1JM44_9GAMM|nr:amidohydrolase [Celerinatantimonas diazotrophica]TCK52087.1 amidohydrolase [Celerinatantimonas diazotrophica]CAG9296208.1 N-acetylcysteine deacetylase [Celerinatantimonas diazotrophica]
MNSLTPPKISVDLTPIRHQLHKIAELSGAEHQTRDYLCQELAKLSAFTTQLLPSGSILSCIDSHQPGAIVLLRADMDALPIQESNQHYYCSQTPGVSHLCGHDGHATSLLGCAHLLEQSPILNGKIYLLFQSAEETGEGGPQALKDMRALGLKFDFAFAYHNIPGAPLGQIICKEKAMTAAVQSLSVQFIGRTAHAAEPESGICPAAAIAQLVQFSQSLNCTDLTRQDFTLVTPICIQMGTPAYGTMPGEGRADFTIRCWQNQQMEIIAQQIEEKLSEICSAAHLNYRYQWLESFRGCDNHPAAVEIIKHSAHALNLHSIVPEHPFKWGEDFGSLIAYWPGALLGIGSGEQLSPLHHVDYDYPDELLPIAANMLAQIAYLTTMASQSL